MKFFPVVACASLLGCGGIRIGTDESVGAISTNGFVAVFRPAAFDRFPGERDSILASRTLEENADVAVPASSSPMILSMWSHDSAVGAWVRDPSSGFPRMSPSLLVAIDLTDSVNYAAYELSVSGTGIATTGIRLDSATARYRVRSCGGIATLAVRWESDGIRHTAYIDSVRLDRDLGIEVSPLRLLPSASRVKLDASGSIRSEPAATSSPP